MDKIIATFRDKQDERIILVVWRVEKKIFELWWTQTDRLSTPASVVYTIDMRTMSGMQAWNQGRAKAVTFARGLAAMNPEQFDRALKEFVA
jgi:hypothetical protein